QRQAHQRLYAAQVDAAIAPGIAMLQRVVGVEGGEPGLVGGRGRGQFGGTGHDRPERGCAGRPAERDIIIKPAPRDIERSNKGQGWLALAREGSSLGGKTT